MQSDRPDEAGRAVCRYVRVDQELFCLAPAIWIVGVQCQAHGKGGIPACQSHAWRVWVALGIGLVPVFGPTLPQLFSGHVYDLGDA